MRPPQYMRSVVDRNVVMRHVPVITYVLVFEISDVRRKVKNFEMNDSKNSKILHIYNIQFM